MILQINTTDRTKISIKLKDKDQVIEELSDENEYGSQVLLGLIEQILKQRRLEFKDLKGIEVETGPGSFTGIRVGVSVANALGFSLGIPVNSKKIETDLKY